MIEKRKHPRIRFDARCILSHDGSTYEGRVVNISLGGAMISIDDGAFIPQEDTCLFQIFVEGCGDPDEIRARVVYSAFSCIGIMFLAFGRDTHPKLYEKIELLSSNPEKYRVAYP
jgi:PilZ domain-containing protein